MNKREEGSHLIDNEGQRRRGAERIVRHRNRVAVPQHLSSVAVDVALVACLPIATVDEHPQWVDIAVLWTEQVETLE